MLESDTIISADVEVTHLVHFGADFGCVAYSQWKGYTEYCIVCACYRALAASSRCYCWHLRHSTVCAITSYCGCVRVPAPAKSHLIAASSRVAAQNSRQMSNPR